MESSISQKATGIFHRVTDGCKEGEGHLDESFQAHMIRH